MNNTTESIKSVVRTALPKGGFRFADQDGNVLRAKATRPYAFAAIHSVPVVSKFSTVEIAQHGDVATDTPTYRWVSKDPRAYVTFHGTSKIPASGWSKDVIERAIKIEEAAQ